MTDIQEKRGRPKKQDIDKKNFSIQVRVTKRKYKAWRFYLKKNNFKESEALRKLLDKALRLLTTEELLKATELDLKEYKKINNFLWRY